MKARLAAFSALWLAGCQLLGTVPEQTAAPALSAQQQHEQAMALLSGGNYLPAATHSFARPGKPLSDYAADLALQLLQSMQYQMPQQPIAISSFVQFDNRLDHTDALGNQLAEHLFYQLQRLGVPLADVKLARQIRITPRGDFVLSRGAYLDLRQQASYVLTGTMLRDNAGVVINARVMHLNSKALLASGQIHIPDFVLAPSARAQQAP